MRTGRALSVGFFAATLLWGGVAWGQQAQAPACTPQDKAKMSPEKVEGRVEKVDTASGKVTLRGADGKVHEFQASKEALQNLKTGDRLEAKLRTC